MATISSGCNFKTPVAGQPGPLGPESSHSGLQPAMHGKELECALLFRLKFAGGAAESRGGAYAGKQASVELQADPRTNGMDELPCQVENRFSGEAAMLRLPTLWLWGTGGCLEPATLARANSVASSRYHKTLLQQDALRASQCFGQLNHSKYSKL